MVIASMVHERGDTLKLNDFDHKSVQQSKLHSSGTPSLINAREISLYMQLSHWGLIRKFQFIIP